MATYIECDDCGLCLFKEDYAGTFCPRCNSDALCEFEGEYDPAVKREQARWIINLNDETLTKFQTELDRLTNQIGNNKFKTKTELKEWMQALLDEMNIIIKGKSVKSLSLGNGKALEINTNNDQKLILKVAFPNTSRAYIFPDVYTINSDIIFPTDNSAAEDRRKLRILADRWYEEQKRINTSAKDLELKKELIEADYNVFVAKLDARRTSISDVPPYKTNYTLWVHGGRIKCILNHHPIQSVTAIVPTLDGNPAKININYCADCRKYFISYDEYTYYLKLYRFIALPFQHTDAPRGSSLSNLKQYSPLSLCGYSVDASRGFTDAERQGILARMILFTPISKWEIMDYLNGFIALGRKNHGKELAVSKWERDLEFVRNFNIDRQRIVRIDEIKRWTSR